MVMKEISKKWFSYAKSDLDFAERAMKSPKPNRWTFLMILWHCQQAIEKGIKMILIEKSMEVLKIHDLSRLAVIAELKISKEDQEFLSDLNVYYLKSRYPDLQYKPLPYPDKKKTEKYLAKTKEFLLWLEKQ